MDYRNCNLCPRECRVDRSGGELGFCAMGDRPVLGRAAPHFWEEPCISGSSGTGAVFFTGCTLGCPYCQNQKLTRENFGAAVTPARLREIFLALIEQGVTSIDLVNPTHFVPSILEALTEPLPVPVIYNCGGYEKKETIEALRGKIDVYLPDLKYAQARLGKRYSQALDYFARAKAAICEMYQQTGDYVLDESGLLQRGVLIRHLVLPGALENTYAVIDWVAETFPPGAVLFSLMGQYMPAGDLERFPELQRPLRPSEYERAQVHLLAKGMEDGYFQELSASSPEYVPEFDLTGVLENK